MSACRLALLLSLVLALACAAGKSGSPDLSFQPVPNFSSDVKIKAIDDLLRAQHPTELASAVLTAADSATDSKNYRLLYTVNGENYLSVTKQDAFSTITEVYWGKLKNADQETKVTTSNDEPVIVGGFKTTSIPTNDVEFDLVDKFVRDQKKEELKDATIESLRTQIVSGVNYKIVYAVKGGKRY